MSNRVQLQPSGKEFELSDGETILDGALAHGIGFPFGCQNGFCGACKAKVVSGEYEYQDEYNAQSLTEDELANDVVICCKAEAKSDLVVEVHELVAVEEIEVRTMPVKVSKIEHLAEDVIRLCLKQPEDESLQFLAGQYIEVILEGNRRRAFSIANAPHNNSEIELHLRRVDGGLFTPHVFNEMKEKDILRVEGPLGTFFLREDSANDLILVAGGTGFAPIKGMVEHAIEMGMDNHIKIYWGARGHDDLYLDSLAREWADSHENISYIPVLSAADESWSGRRGYVHEAVVEDHSDLSAVDIYMAGPPVMIDAGKSAFSALGLTADHLYFDSFEVAGEAGR
ncbi:MAG: CDP-6-deoxy-delta-3,4-glucoseen reductase [Gammaproteobacteria bacterium]|uniref:CDP-6-deoxy-delta-3,4-glucoseen reductase n=1 Tax=Candidatus Thiopontia autotrophica TaxID=2841688 RepID=A0A8J6NXY9_9GAMM|nr:CDP-6-deoxy-delta-3,4-glucoseen reductase [Candidatus Thiopontia autotrophica]MBL6969352.1 CDP-6-deoxy-delta-3,4-glucoseen reductase [Gammaproteobacteria bacterium]